MFDARTVSRCLTFSSFAASSSSETDSHCCRSPTSCQTARHRPPFSRGRIHSDPQVEFDYFPVARVAARVSMPATRPAAKPVAFGFAVPLRARLTAPWDGCGDCVGILKIEAGACVIFTSSLPAFPQVGGLTLAV